MWIYNNEIIKVKKQVTIGSTTYPPQMFLNQELRESLGIKQYELVRESFDSKYYWDGQTVRTETDTTVTDTITRGEARLVQDRLEVNEDGTPMLDQDGNQVVTKGLVSAIVDKIKTKAGNDIIAKYPEYKQRNYLAMYNNLLEKKLDGTITDEEAATMTLLKSIWQDIQAIRDASNLEEQKVLAFTTIEEVINYEQPATEGLV